MKLNVTSLTALIRAALQTAEKTKGRWVTVQEGPLAGYAFRRVTLVHRGLCATEQFNYRIPGDSKRYLMEPMLKVGQVNVLAKELVARFKNQEPDYFGPALTVPAGCTV